ncbi:hypothetical protein C8A03DRAFT_17364 [Achaetomium macrosporum]|uniref:ADP-ribose 1''-phosphate phosphatase n=1 Tax=Achaetomium macrosporum TaxID=79813 RepID=A0AAN7C6P1_9PEZI|nr:hypothetical protein C8A03DRAFT_17364 [Achaetomium macrosporum]
MSGKRPASANSASNGSRQFKQTRLNFFTSSRSQSKKPSPETEERQEKSTTVTAGTRDGVDTETKPATGPDPSVDLPKPEQTDNSIVTAEAICQEPETSPPPPPSPAITSPQPALIPTPSSKIRITDRTGDLFAAPPNSLLIHACNSVGSWGGGIALAFRNLYPEAFQVYRAHCAARSMTPEQLVGTALLIPPPPPPRRERNGGKEEGGGKKKRQHYIGCLFTSRRYGKARDSPERILSATGPAMRHLMRLVVEEERREGAGVIKEVRMCRINAGLFAVPWERSKKVIEELELGEGQVPQCAEEGVVKVVAYERK